MKKSYLAMAFLICSVFCGGELARASDAHSSPVRIEIMAKRFQFAPAEITLKRGQPVVFIVRSSDVAHGLRCRELNLDMKIGKGAATEAQVTPDQVGTFIAHCAVFCGSGHGQMILTIHVVD